MSRAEIKKEAKKLLVGNHLTILIMMILVTVISYAAGNISTTILFSAINATPDMGANTLLGYLLIYIVVYIFMLAFVLSLGLGLIKTYTKVVKEEDISITDVFCMVKHMGKAFCMNFVVSLYTTLWSLLFIIPGIIKTYSYAATPYIIANNPDMKINDAITKSRELMDGHKFELFVLQLSFIGWMLLGILTLGIGLLYVLPYMSITLANFFVKIGVIDGNTNPIKTEGEVVE